MPSTPPCARSTPTPQHLPSSYDSAEACDDTDSDEGSGADDAELGKAKGHASGPGSLEVPAARAQLFPEQAGAWARAAAEPRSGAAGAVDVAAANDRGRGTFCDDGECTSDGDDEDDAGGEGGRGEVEWRVSEQRPSSALLSPQASQSAARNWLKVLPHPVLLRDDFSQFCCARAFLSAALCVYIKRARAVSCCDDVQQPEPVTAALLRRLCGLDSGSRDSGSFGGGGWGGHGDDTDGLLACEVAVTLSVDTVRGDPCDALGELMPRLEQLSLFESSLASVRDLGTSLRRLRVLRCPRCGLSELDGLAALCCLEELYASFNDVWDLSAVAFHEALQILDLEANAVDETMQVGKGGKGAGSRGWRRGRSERPVRQTTPTPFILLCGWFVVVVVVVVNAAAAAAVILTNKGGAPGDGAAALVPHAGGEPPGAALQGTGRVPARRCGAAAQARRPRRRARDRRRPGFGTGSAAARCRRRHCRCGQRGLGRCCRPRAPLPFLRCILGLVIVVVIVVVVVVCFCGCQGRGQSSRFRRWRR